MVPFLRNLLEDVLQQQNGRRTEDTSQAGGEGKASQEDSKGQQGPSCSDQRIRMRASGSTTTIGGRGEQLSYTFWKSMSRERETVWKSLVRYKNQKPAK